MKNVILFVIFFALIGGAIGHAGIVVVLLIFFAWIAFVALRWLFR
jgi:hypothetical protein